eukprot:m.183288 g.183288  ORF g.183288 m.183288 type:complete len:620 (-) comp15541_c1_seq2:131-1990(-)
MSKAETGSLRPHFPKTVEECVTLLREQEQELKKRRDEVRKITEENGQLYTQLQLATQQLAERSNAGVDAGHATRGGYVPPMGHGNSDKNAISLLQDENDILAEQVQQLKRELEESRKEASNLMKFKEDSSKDTQELKTSQEETPEMKATLDEAASRVKLAEQLHSQTKTRAEALEQQLQDLQVTVVEAHEQLKTVTIERDALQGRLALAEKTAEGAAGNELESYEQVQKLVQLLESARLERDQAIAAQARLEAKNKELEENISAFAKKGRDDTANAVDKLRTETDTRCTSLIREIEDLQRQNTQLTLAVERATKAKVAIENEYEKLSKDAAGDETLRVLSEQLQSQLTTTQRFNEQQRQSIQQLESKLHQAETENIQMKDARSHEISESERRYQILKQELQRESEKGSQLQQELEDLRRSLAGTKKELNDANNAKQTQTSLLKRQLEMMQTETKAKIDSTTGMCEKAVENFRRMMTEQQRKAGMKIEELKASLARMEQERNFSRQQLSFCNEKEKQMGTDLVRCKKELVFVSRQLSDTASRLEMAEKSLEDEVHNAQRAELQILELVSKQSDLVNEISQARQARDICDLESRKYKRQVESLTNQMSELEASLTESHEVT